MTTCDHPYCDGHLAKFDSCRDETLYALTMDAAGVDEHTGDSDFEGHYTLMNFSTEETHCHDDIALGEPVVIPAGAYILHTNSQGFVSVSHFTTDDEARAIFNEAESRYAAWDEQ